jgi:hypothetical protein
VAAYYQIDRDKIIIRPLSFLAPIGIAIVTMLLLFPLAIILIMVGGHLQQIEPKSFGSYILVLPLLLACIPLFTYSRRQLIFDADEQNIYLKKASGKKTLMAFNQVDSINWVARFGIAYYMRSKKDKYGKGYRISPSFSNEKDKDKLQFDQVVLPAIWKILASKTVATSPENAETRKVLFDAGQLNYYQTQPEGYILKPMKTTRYLVVLFLFGLFALYTWYQLLFKPMLTGNDKEMAIFALIPLFACALTITKRVVFNVEEQKIKLYRLGFVNATYPISTFAGFNIVRKTYNGMYNGTDVRLKFTKPGSKQERELILADFNKTNPIEEFLDETEFILKKVAKSQ